MKKNETEPLESLQKTEDTGRYYFLFNVIFWIIH